MATRKTTSKAKSKTSKTRSASAKTALSKSLQTAASTKTLSVVGLRKLHIISIGVFGLLILMTFLYMKDAAYQTTLSYLTRDALTGNIVPAIRHFRDFEIRWLVAATMLISMILPLLYVTKFKRRYELGLQNKLMPWRWLDMAVTTVFIAETTLLLSGLTDVAGLKLVGIVAALTGLFGWLSERENMQARSPIWATYWAGMLMKIGLLIVLAISAISTIIYGSLRASWYVYALYVVLDLYILLYYINHYKQLRGQDYIKTERNYLVLNLVGKSLFALALIIGLMR
jgi:hypothetical protein